MKQACEAGLAGRVHRPCVAFKIASDLDDVWMHEQATSIKILNHKFGHARGILHTCMLVN